MNRFVLALLIMVVAAALVIFSVRSPSDQRPVMEKADLIQIIRGPELESATDNSAIISWTTKAGGSLIEHAVVHYGTDPKNLSRKSESLNRRSQNLSYMIHRVYVTDLRPNTTYYYTVESVRGDGAALGEKSSAVNQFTTPPAR